MSARFGRAAFGVGIGPCSNSPRARRPGAGIFALADEQSPRSVSAARVPRSSPNQDRCGPSLGSRGNREMKKAERRAHLQREAPARWADRRRPFCGGAWSAPPRRDGQPGVSRSSRAAGRLDSAMIIVGRGCTVAVFGHGARRSRSDAAGEPDSAFHVTLIASRHARHQCRVQSRGSLPARLHASGTDADAPRRRAQTRRPRAPENRPDVCAARK